MSIQELRPVLMVIIACLIVILLGFLYMNIKRQSSSVDDYEEEEAPKQKKLKQPKPKKEKAPKKTLKKPAKKKSRVQLEEDETEEYEYEEQPKVQEKPKVRQESPVTPPQAPSRIQPPIEEDYSEIIIDLLQKVLASVSSLSPEMLSLSVTSDMYKSQCDIITELEKKGYTRNTALTHVEKVQVLNKSHNQGWDFVELLVDCHVRDYIMEGKVMRGCPKEVYPATYKIVITKHPVSTNNKYKIHEMVTV